MTASFVIAMSIAISGPPSDEEMRQAAAVADKGAQTLARATRRFADGVCQQIPEICTQSTDVVQEPAHAAPRENPAPSPAAAPTQSIVASVEQAPPELDEASLLGASSQPDAAIAAPARAARPVHRTSTHRGAPRRPGPRRAPPLPPLQARVQGAASLPAEAQPDIAVVTPTVAHEINRPAPSEDEAAPQRDDPETATDPYADWQENGEQPADEEYDEDALVTSGAAGNGAPDFSRHRRSR